MAPLQALAAEYGIALLEDAAHGLFGTYRQRSLGTFGTLGTYSFDALKNVSCGEGGALLINDPDLTGAVEVAYQRGTNKSEFLRGQSDHYEWLGSGGNYSPSELQAAFLLGQLEGAEQIQDRRRQIWQQYQEGLAAWAEAEHAQLPVCPPDCVPAYHLFFLLLKTAADRPRMIQHLADSGIASAFHFMPLHQSPGGQRFQTRSDVCTVATDVSARLLRLPLYPVLSDQDVERVITAVCAFRT
jgi:dTDP-4-amino-4,6-dideoxygalactose transaminase